MDQGRHKGARVLLFSYGHFDGEYAAFQAPQNPSSVLNECNKKEERLDQVYTCPP